MSVLTQRQGTFAIRTPWSLLVAGSIMVGLGLLLLIGFIDARFGMWDVTNSLGPYAPGGPDLEWSAA